MNHAGLNAYALRFEIESKYFVYSGASGPCQGLEKAANNADLFICEANQEIGTKNNSHLTIEEGSLIAQKSHVKKLAFTHLRGQTDDDEIITEAKKTYQQEVSVTHDFDVLQL